jgi:hypothetical protein
MVGIAKGYFPSKPLIVKLALLKFQPLASEPWPSPDFAVPTATAFWDGLLSSFI